MDAITLLRKQHNEVKSLFKQFEKTDQPKRQMAIFEEIADSLAAHATIEEKIFYPTVFREQTHELLEEAVEEHLVAKRIIADLLMMGPSERQFVAKVSVLREMIKHHIEEEQNELFPRVREELSAKELKAMGEEMKQLYDQLMAKKPRKNVPAEVKAAAPLPASA